MTDRRTILGGAGAFGLLALAGCGKPPPPPATATVTASGAAGMNPGPDGADRPLTLTVLQLRGTGAFGGADFLSLQSPEAALGADLISATQVTVAPGGGSASATLALDPAATAIGVVAGFREPGGKSFRAVAPVKPGESVSLTASVTASGVTVASG